MRYLLLCLFTYVSFLTLHATQSITVDYYGQNIQLNYDPDMVFQWRVCAKDRCIKEFYNKLDKSGAYQVLVNDLLKTRDRLELNDWLYYVLVRKAAEQLYADIKTDNKEEMPETTASWFLLVKSGYNVDLGNAALKHLFILAPSKKKLYGIGRSSMKRGWYAYNLSAHYLKINAKLAALSMNEFDPDPKDGRFMDLAFSKHPKLGNPTISKSLTIKTKEKNYELNVQIDTMITHYMKLHPKMKQEDYMGLPLSESLAKSLLPQLQEILKGKSEEEAMSILLSFTRRTFKYKWDWHIYDDDCPMIADRVFLEPFSDHEDKSALFTFLVQQLYGYKMAVIQHFNFDITIGVALNQPVGDPYMIDGVAYTICDPTSPTNSNKVGRYPNGFTDKTAELLRIMEEVEPAWPIPRVEIPALVEPTVKEEIKTVEKIVDSEINISTESTISTNDNIFEAVTEPIEVPSSYDETISTQNLSLKENMEDDIKKEDLEKIELIEVSSMPLDSTSSQNVIPQEAQSNKESSKPNDKVNNSKKIKLVSPLSLLREDN